VQNSFKICSVIDVRRLRVLQELERHQTVTAAATALHLSPSAVSQQLALLAQEVGCPVIERDGRNVRLTTAARVLLDHTTELFARLESLTADLQRHQSGDVGVVRVSSFQTAASAIVVPAARELSVTRPRLEIHLVQMDAPRSFEEVAAGRIDISVSVEYIHSPPSADPRFTRVPLLHDEFRALLPAGHRLASRKSVSLADLSDEPWIGSLLGSPCHFVTMAACASAGFSPKLRHEVDDWAIIVDMVAAGMGIALIPTLARPPQRDDIAIRPLNSPTVARNIFALTRRGTEEAPTIAAVLLAMKEAAGAPQPRNRSTVAV
jgi:DNA-binding transcriptional LysR family regulator